MTAVILPMTENDFSAASRIIGLAFGTFMGVPDPENFMSDIQYPLVRWQAEPASAFKAEIDGELVGSNFATRWGSVGFLGPLTVRPDLWDKGVGKQLMAPIIELFDQWGVTNAGLFTMAHSPKHLGFYHHFDFWPRNLTAIMEKPVSNRKEKSGWTTYSSFSEKDRKECVRACREITDSIYPGLDVEWEINAVYNQGIGETVLLSENNKITGLGVCHWGPNSEAGTDNLYMKFGAVKKGETAENRFTCLLEACETIAAANGLQILTGGVNTGRHEAYRTMLKSGFRSILQGVVMQRGNKQGYNEPGVFLIDDWR